MLLITALFVSGCCSSSDSSSVGSQSSSEINSINGGGENADDDSTAGTNDVEDSNTGNTTTGLLGTEEPSTTRVNFDITVPAYVSNALQVRVVWGRYYRGVEP